MTLSLLRQFLVVVALVAMGAPPAFGIVQADFRDDAPPKRDGVMRNVVAVRYTFLKVVGGSGVLISPNTVLTSGHGVDGWSKSQLMVELGDAKKTLLAVERIDRHPDKNIDLAVLRLKQSVEAAPVTLLNRAPHPGERVWLGGYGIYGAPGKPKGFGRFHDGYNLVTHVSGGKANVRFDREGIDGEALPAAFDSGSPVWVKTKSGWALSGISVTATGREGPAYGERSEHQLVAPVRDWIRSQVSP